MSQNRILEKVFIRDICETRSEKQERLGQARRGPPAWAPTSPSDVTALTAPSSHSCPRCRLMWGRQTRGETLR